MLSDKFFSVKYWTNKYWWFEAIVVTGQSFAGAYAIIVRYKLSARTAVFYALRGVTVELDRTAIAEDADQQVIERIGRSAIITGGTSDSTIERVQ